MSGSSPGRHGIEGSACPSSADIQNHPFTAPPRPHTDQTPQQPRRRTRRSRQRLQPSSSRSRRRVPSCPSSKRSVSGQQYAVFSLILVAHCYPFLMPSLWFLAHLPPPQAPSRSWHTPPASTRRRPSSGKTRMRASLQRARQSRSSCAASARPYTRSTPSSHIGGATRTIEGAAPSQQGQSAKAQYGRLIACSLPPLISALALNVYLYMYIWVPMYPVCENDRSALGQPPSLLSATARSLATLLLPEVARPSVYPPTTSHDP